MMGMNALKWIKRLWEKMFGRKYYLVVFRTNIGDDCEISSHRFRNKQDALTFGIRNSIIPTVEYYTTVCFRSKKNIPYYVEK